MAILILHKVLCWTQDSRTQASDNRLNFDQYAHHHHQEQLLLLLTYLLSTEKEC